MRVLIWQFSNQRQTCQIKIPTNFRWLFGKFYACGHTNRTCVAVLALVKGRGTCIVDTCSILTFKKGRSIYWTPEAIKPTLANWLHNLCYHHRIWSYASHFSLVVLRVGHFYQIWWARMQLSTLYTSIITSWLWQCKTMRVTRNSYVIYW